MIQIIQSESDRMKDVEGHSLGSVLQKELCSVKLTNLCLLSYSVQHSRCLTEIHFYFHSHRRFINHYTKSFFEPSIRKTTLILLIYFKTTRISTTTYLISVLPLMCFDCNFLYLSSHSSVLHFPHR